MKSNERSTIPPSPVHQSPMYVYCMNLFIINILCVNTLYKMLHIEQRSTKETNNLNS